MQTLRKKLTTISSATGLLLVLIILSSALVVQFVYHEEPCPLCLLQRAALINIGLALLLNLRYGNKIAHWGMVVLSACAGIAVSIRQILLHITTPEGFGSPVLGLHLYTWTFIAFAIAIVGSALVLILLTE